MGTTIDSLDIEISASAKQANQSLNALVSRLQKVNSSLTGINSTGLSNLSLGVNRLSQSMQNFSQTKTTEFTRLAKNLNQIGTIDASKFNSLAIGLSDFSRSLNGIQNIGDVSQIAELAKSIRAFGYKSVTSAIANMPLLANGLKQMLESLSHAPRVSQNLIDMTNALANLASQGSKVGRSANSLDRYFNRVSSGSNKAGHSIKSLAYYFGKFYANFWLVRRGIGLMKNAIEYSSDLVEVQNVVDTSFGNYADKMEDFSKYSIENFGLSELTSKKIAGRFQAMGIAMGFTQEKMSDMSIELTKLAGDMASFYNVESDVVAEDLEAVFTGQTRPLRQYGLDLTEATLNEWAMKRGIDANLDSMSQAQKMLLRYQYVMENTQMAQGDFVKTQMTWANQTRILKQNFQALGGVIGGIGTNAFKPFIVAMNQAMTKAIQFATVISNSLGKIFGWEYQEGGGAILDVENADDYSDALGDAAGNAKKLKDNLLGIDELNIINNKDNGGSGGASDAGVGSDSGGQWTQKESIFKQYESDLDSLFKLGDAIQDRFSTIMENIDWNKVYDKAKGFGTGLASFLNGLITPRLFGNVGTTIAGSLNTAIYEALAFGQEFDWENLGKSIASGITNFFDTFDTKALADTIDVWVQGIWTTIKTTIKETDWSTVWDDAKDFLSNIDIETLSILFNAITLKYLGNILTATTFPNIVARILGMKGGELILTVSAFLVMTSLTLYVGSHAKDWINNAKNWLKELIVSKDEAVTFDGKEVTLETPLKWKVQEIKIDLSQNNYGDAIKKLIALIFPINWWEEDGVFSFEWTNEFLKKSLDAFKTAFDGNRTDFMDFGCWILEGILDGFVGALSFIGEPIARFFIEIGKSIIKVFDIHSPAKKMKVFGENIFMGILVGFESKFMEIPNTIDRFFTKLKDEIKNRWNAFADWLNSKLQLTIDPIVIAGKTIFQGATLDFGKLPKFEVGGFPEDGLFFANHNELVGQFSNGKTAVANNEQIVSGISIGVRQAVRDELAPYLRDIADYTNQTAQKDFSVNIGDRDIARANQRGQRAMGLTLRTT